MPLLDLNDVKIADGMEEITMELLNLKLGTPVISRLREIYKGKWVYRGHGNWEHVGKGYARYVAFGDDTEDLAGSVLYYYPKNGKPERVELSATPRINPGAWKSLS